MGKKMVEEDVSSKNYDSKQNQINKSHQQQP